MQLPNIRKLTLDAAHKARQHLTTLNALRPTPPLLSAVTAERGILSTVDAGTISYYVDGSGSGRPVVLLHGIHAAASVFEMRNLFEAFRGERPVYAADLPGFGFSERSGKEPYTDATYVHAIEHLLRHVANERPGERADVIALSLSCEYAAAALADLPELIHSLVLISPTGFNRAHQRPRAGAPQWLKATAEGGGELFYDLLVTRPSLKYYLRKNFAGPIDRDLLNYAYATSHQPGAHFAPLAFVAGELFPKTHPQQVYGKIKVPVLVLYDKDPYSSFAGLEAFVQQHPNFQSQRITPSRGLPQVEMPARTEQCVRDFWTRAERSSERRQAPPLTAAGGRANGGATSHRA